MRRYVTGALALTVFGFLAGYSLGPGLFLLGVVLLALTPVRRRAVLFWPPVAASLAWVAAWYASAPMRCSATQTTAGATTLSCGSLLGVTSSDPAAMMDAAVSFAGAAAVTTFLVVLAIMLVRARTASRPA